MGKKKQNPLSAAMNHTTDKILKTTTFYKETTPTSTLYKKKEKR